MKVLAEHNGKVVERYVGAVAGSAAGHHLAGVGPGPVDAGIRQARVPGGVVGGGDMLPQGSDAAIEFEQNRAAGISSHYEHNLIPPPAVERAIEGDLNLDEVTEGDTRTAVRFLGPIRLATYAASGRVPGAGPGWSTPTASG